MQKLRILKIGAISGTCLDRANAMRRLGHEVVHVDLRAWLPGSVWIDRITVRLGGHLFAPYLSRKLHESLAGQHFDLVYVDNGEYVSPMVIHELRKLAPRVVNYNIDDPTGTRDKQRFAAYRRAIPFYDLLAVVREENVPECLERGARRVLRVWRSADEINHAPRAITADIQAKWGSEVLFLGTWMTGRGAFLLELIAAGVPLTICGSRWEKAPEWPQLQPYWRCGELKGDDYAYAIQCAKVCIGLLSKGNRDLHTTRTLEIPSLGGMFCAERTSEHLACYTDGQEAVFWDDAQECARHCKNLLQDDKQRQRIAQAGRERFLANHHGNEDIMAHVLMESMR